ncbi:MAG: bifunctional 5,10-methylenetetrahydrofolate dehydrogenase/5,10-methenyltetrahydrofolate cyclohydrolase [Actinomycetota bacterium]
MSARILDGTAVAAEVRRWVADRVDALAGRGKSVGLATVLVGDDPASRLYVDSKRRAAEEAGIRAFDHSLPAGAALGDVERLIDRLNESGSVDGILVQLPLPPGLDEAVVLGSIDPSKDADGLHPTNLGMLVMDRPGVAPATPTGILTLLDHYGIPTDGAMVVVVGRSLLVGRPLAILLGLKGRDATVALAHSHTPDLAALTRQADILVAAAGRPGLIGAHHVKPGATVVDVGINQAGEGLIGDVDFEAVAEVAGAITPVPGGVGPMTIASLLENTVAAAERRITGRH